MAMTPTQRNAYVERLLELDIPQVEEELRLVRNARDLERAQIVGFVLTLRRSMGGSLISPVLAVGRRTKDSLLASLVEYQGNELRAALSGALRQANRDMMLAAERATLKQMDEIVDLQRGTIDSILTPEQKRMATGLPIDSTGLVMPAVASVPGVIEDDNLQLRDILLIASPLIVTGGYSLLQGAAGAIVSPPADALNAGRVAGLEAWLQRMRRIAIPIRSSASAMIDAWKQDERTAGTVIDRILGLRSGKRGRSRIGDPDDVAVGGNGIARKIQNNLRHDGRRLYEQSLDATRDKSDVFTGVQILSVFAERTRIEHANRSGITFYKDGRGGLKWEDRIRLPDAPNCLCFTRDILVDSVGKEHIATWQITDNPELDMNPRNPRTWARWFNDQRESSQRRLIGDDRYNALASKGRVTYEGMTNTRGQFLSPRVIANEDPAQRRDRVLAVRDLMTQIDRANTKALAEGLDLWELTDTDEEKMRRRIEAVMRMVEK